MIRQSMLLIRLQLLKTMGINEILHGKDNRKSLRTAILLLAYMLVGLMVMGYTAGAAVLLCAVGAGNVVPAFIVAVSSMVIFIFSLFRAGPVLFETGDLEQLTALPLVPSAILVSRFFLFYSEAVLLALGTVLPSGIVYLLMEGPGISFAVFLVISIPFIPLIPLTLACTIGAAIMALSAGMRYKRLIVLACTLLLTGGLVAWSFSLSFYSGEVELQDLAAMVEGVVAGINRMYPPAMLYTAGVTEGNAAAFLAFLFLSAAVFVLFTAVVQRYFGRITEALKARSASGRYRMESLRRMGIRKAVWQRELRRYFASNVYVVNTLIGYLMMVILAVVLTVAGRQRVIEIMQIPGMDTEALIRRSLPFLFALIGIMGNTTPVSISMEGRQLWLIQSLPIRSDVIFTGKILVNLTAAVPSVLLSALILALGGWMDNLFLIAIPLSFILLSSVIGIWMNLKMPEFAWETETDAVKRSASMMLCMLASALSIVPFAVGILLTGWAALVVNGLAVLVPTGAAAWLFGRLCRYDLRRLE